MELTLIRKYPKETYTIGQLYVDGKFFCNVLEDKDRGLYQTMTSEEIKEKKVYAQTAIPYGRYRVTLNIQSPKFSTVEKYRFCKGYLPRLLSVPGFEGILIHIGTSAKDSAGCLLVGYNTEKGKVLQSEKVFKELYAILKEANDNGEKIYITIKEK